MYRWLIIKKYSINTVVFKTLVNIRVTWRTCLSRFLSPIHKVSDSVGQGKGLRICKSKECPGGTDATGPETIL